MVEKMLIKIKLLPRIFLVSIVVVLCFLFALVWLYGEVKESKYDAKRAQLQYLIETTSGILQYYYGQYQSGILSEEDAKQMALAEIETIRYDGTNYYWINDLRPYMIMHPVDKTMFDRNLSDYEDAKGKRIFLEFIDACEETGAGFVDYQWPKPGTTKPIPKISYVKLFAPWGWIIGTGIYVDDVDTEIARLTNGALLVLAVAIGIGLFISFILARSVSNPIQQMSIKAQAIAEGDLGQRIQYEAKDEVGDLAKAFNQMVFQLQQMFNKEQEQRVYLESTIDKYVAFTSKVMRGDLMARIDLGGNESRVDDPLVILGASLNEMTSSLQQMLDRIRSSASELSAASTEILAATTQQAAGASEQSAAISQITTTVDEVKVISEQASQRIQDVANASQRTVETGRTGQRALQEMLESMGLIKERVEGIAENILALSDQTQQIGDIITTVNEIASQSNMLALNASVEAARAGEHGKGFAVVAMEVRNLAEQSRQATGQIKTILSEIQRATNSTVMATEEGTKGVERGVQLSAQARDALEQLGAVINESAQIATQVVAGGHQQQTGIEQIALAMQNINQATVQSLAGIRQAEKSAQNLNELAVQLAEMIRQYENI